MTATTAAERTAAERLDSVRHPAVRRLVDVLRTRSASPRTCVIEDGENIERAVAAGVGLDSLYLSTAAAGALAEPADVPRYELAEGVAATVFGGGRRPRVFALAHAPRPARLRDLLARRGDVLVLDGVRMAGNIGAIVRTATALGAAGVILIDSGLCTVLDRRLIRASRGLVFATPVAISSAEQLAGLVRRRQLRLATLSADATEPLGAVRDVGERLALVLGGERHGVSSRLDALAEHRYAIPMARGVESLNVSVAAGIALHERGGGAPR